MYNTTCMGKLCLKSIIALALCLCFCGCKMIEETLASLAGESDEGTTASSEAALEGATYEDGIPRIRVGVGVIAQVSVIGEPVREFEMMCDQNGEVMPPYLLTEPVKCNKMTLDEFRQELIKRYRKYIKQPQISVRFAPEFKGGVSPYGSVKVLGYVNNPGPVNMPPTMDLTVTKALQAAGGFRQFANQRSIQISRREQDGSLRKEFVDVIAIARDGGEDRLLKAGDVVYVRETYF